MVQLNGDAGQPDRVPPTKLILEPSLYAVLSSLERAVPFRAAPFRGVGAAVRPLGRVEVKTWAPEMEM